MAFSSVVTNSYFQRMIDTLEQLEQERGAITLAVMTPFDLGNTERWSLYIAAEWLDAMRLLEATRMMRLYFQKHLGPFAGRFQQAFVFRTADREVSIFSSKFDVSELGTAYRVSGLDLDRFDDDTVLFIARPAKAASHKTQITAA